MLDPFATLGPLGYGDWHRMPLRGDASTRQFLRLIHPDGRRTIAMHTPHELAPSQTAFANIASLLSAHQIAAPEILCNDIKSGVLVMQDLGDTDIATALKHNPAQEVEQYRTAIDVLCRIQNIPNPDGLLTLTPTVGADMLEPFFTFFAPTATAAQGLNIMQSLSGIMAATLTGPLCLSLRDYHAENLIWRPDQTGTDRIGVLDFQDAFLAPPEYDLVSLLRDARRDVSAQTHADATAYFAQSTGKSLAGVQSRCAVLGVQRNLRILGIFARLAQREGKSGYLALIPRVRQHILNDLSHPVMRPMQDLLLPLLEERPA